MGYRRFVGAILMVMLVSSPCSAASSPRVTLEDFFRRAIAILSEATDPKAARDEVGKLAHGMFDGQMAAERALGSEWDRHSDAERRDFSRTFSTAFGRAYLDMLAARLPRDRPPEIQFVAEDVDADGNAAIVRTKTQARDGNDIHVDYVMIRGRQNWLVHDVVMDGLSLVENYQAQFARVLKTSSWDDLVARLRTVAGDEGSTLTASPRTESVASVRGTDSLRDVVTHFDLGRVELNELARRDLDRAIAWLAANRESFVLIEGHSDQQGDIRLNDALAQRRASAVREYLMSRGIDGDRVVVVTYGDRRPVCRETSEACWAQNRRAVIRVTP